MPINRGVNGTPEYEPSDSDDEEGERRPKRQCGFRDEVEGDELVNWKVHPQAVPSAPRPVKLHRPTREPVWLESFEDGNKEAEMRIKKSDAVLLMKHLARTSPWYTNAMMERTKESLPSGLEVNEHFATWLHMFKLEEAQRLEEATNMSNFLGWFVSWFNPPREKEAAGAYQWMVDEMKPASTAAFRLPDVLYPSPEQILRQIDKWSAIHKVLHDYAM